MIAPEVLRLVTAGWSNPRLPVLVFRGAIAADDPDAVEAALSSKHWRPDWRDGVYGYHHFHSTAHEALACIGGSAELILGGPEGAEVKLATGDLVVLPAGTGHCRRSATSDFLVIGAYPDGQAWDICREASDHAAALRIEAVPMPAADPLYGVGGSLLQAWEQR